MAQHPDFSQWLPAETTSPEATMALGGQLAAHLKAGDVVALYGNLGAGKTHLVKGICAGLGIPADTVSSPTFTLVNEYVGAPFPVYHIDAYRIERLEECYEFGYEEYVYGPGLCLIEWPERIEPLLPEHTISLHLTHTQADGRRIA